MYYEHSTCHVNDWDTLGNTYDQFDACGCGFHDGISCAWRWHKDTASTSSRGLYCFCYSIENGYTFYRCAAFAWGHAADNVCTRRNHVACVKLSFTACNSLNDDSCSVVKQNTHALVLTFDVPLATAKRGICG